MTLLDELRQTFQTSPIPDALLPSPWVYEENRYSSVHA